MQDPSNRFVVRPAHAACSGRRDAGGRVPQWLVTRRNGCPERDAVTALAQLPDAERSRTPPTARGTCQRTQTDPFWISPSRQHLRVAFSG